MILKKISIFIVFLSLFITGYSNLKFEHFSNKEGFNQNTVNTIVSDKYGFLWIGTPNGLIKYDGYNFNSYTHDPSKNSISNNYVQSLYSDYQGNIWIGTRSGIDVYSTKNEKFYRLPEFYNLSIQQITSDYKNRIWITGEKTLAVCELVNNGDSILFNVSKNLFNSENYKNGIPEICFIDSNKFVSYRDSGIFKAEFEEDSGENIVKIKSIHNYDNFSKTVIKKIIKVNNILWVGTDHGLYKIIIDGGKINIIEKPELKTWDGHRISEINVLSIFNDVSGNLWVGTKENGIFRYNSLTNSFYNYGYNPKDDYGISSSRINCFFQDKYGVIWIGTAQGGLNKLDIRQKQFLSYSNNPYDDSSLSGNLINSILEDSKGKLWVSVYNNPICRSTVAVDDENIEKLSFERLHSFSNKNKDNFANFIYEDKKGYIWFGGTKTISVYNPKDDSYKDISFVYDKSKFVIATCRIIDQIDSNTIVFGGNKVVIVKNPWEYIQNNQSPVLKANVFLKNINSVQSFIKDSNGRFWFGTKHGLFVCNYDGFRIYNIKRYSIDTKDSLKLSHDDIFSLFQDSHGTIWVGTFGGGLNKIMLNEKGEPFSIEYFQKSGILPDDAVYGILQEDDDHLWFSTDMGLCRMNLTNNNIDLFDVRDGLINNNFRQGAYFKGNSGYFYFGGLNGLTIFNPNKIKFNDILSNTLIAGLSVDNKRVRIGEEINGDVILKKSIFETKKITINHKAKSLTFYIESLHSATPLKNKLAYKLQGFSNEWVKINKGTASVTYTNLPAGDYELYVKSSNGDGFWNNKPSKLLLSVLPPWYKTWWSYILFSLIIIFIVIGLFLYFIRLEKLEQQIKFEQKDRNRIEKVTNERLQFFTNISHEFRTPLTLIAGPLEKVLAKNKDKECSGYLNIIQNNTKRLLSLVNQLITFRKIEQGHFNLKLSCKTLGDFIYPAAEAFEDYAVQKNINFFYKVNSPNEKVIMDVEKTERILFNLLSNSFKHTPAHGSISIETNVISNNNRKKINIKVIDTGEGIAEDQQKKIFERFYQIDGQKGNIGGTGIGLAYCKSLIDYMGGSISVESKPGVRTCFSIILPFMENKNLKIEEEDVPSFIRDWIPIQKIDKDETKEKIKLNDKKYSIVLVEDDVDVSDFIYNLLIDEYSVIIAENGKDGLEKIRENKPDLVISDVMMPVMDGFALCERIKSDHDICNIPVILLTALGDKKNVIHGLEYGADDYISKPFSPKYLETRVRKLIENNCRLKEYFSKSSSIPDDTIEISSRDKKFLKQIIDIIENNLSDSGFGVEELSAEIGLSSSQFYRRLKQLTGQVPNVYIRNYRLQRAAELLKSNKGYNVTEVMYQIGIESNSYFSTSFKKLFGVSPSEYLKNDSTNKCK